MPKVKKKSKYSLFKNKFVVIAALLLAGFLGSRAIISYVAAPAGINEIGKTQVAWTGTERQPNGCYTKEVQCVQAPCEPILVCPPGVTPAPTPQMCTQEVGSCLNGVGECVGYTDGCQKSKMCGTDIRKCDLINQTPLPTSSPISCTCPPGAMCKLDARCNPSPTALPSPTAVPSTPRPQVTPPPNCTSWFDGCNTCTVKDGAILGCTKMACKTNIAIAECRAYVSPTPTPSIPSTPPPVVTLTGLTSFNVSKACGSDSYLDITFSCHNQKVLKTLANNVCTDFFAAMRQAIVLCDGSGTKTTDIERQSIR